MIITSEALAKSMCISWAVAADGSMDWVSVMTELDGIRNMLIHCHAPEEVREDAKLLWCVALTRLTGR